METKLPVYELTVDEVDEGVQYIALVDMPAIERSYMAFSKNSFKFKETGERRVLTGPIMLADTPIYRNDEKGEYYVIFSKETLRKIVQKYFKQGNQHNVNAEHKVELDGVYLFESYLTDASRGINPPNGYEGCADGSWFGSFKVENDQVWENREAFTGFSVEGLFGMERPGNQSKASEIDLITNELRKIRQSICIKETKTTFKSMSFKTAMANLRAELQKFATTLKLNFADYKLSDGTTVRVDGDLIPGTAVFVITETGTLPAPDGEHVIEGVGKIYVQGGVIMEIEGAEPAAAAPAIPGEAGEGQTDVAAEIAPDAATIIVDKVKEGYPEIDPAVIEQIVQKHLISIMEELKTAYTQLSWMKEKMSMFSTQVDELKAEVKRIGELPQQKPQEFSTPHAGIANGRREQTASNFDAVVNIIKNNNTK